MSFHNIFVNLHTFLSVYARFFQFQGGTDAEHSSAVLINQKLSTMRSKTFIILTFSILLALSLNVSAKEFTLVIDAGHGGQDAGAVGSFSKEKDINLRTALAFGKNVERNCPDVKVIYTRKTDVFVTLKGRADIANKAKADLFISIHTNALPPGNNTAKGLETYTLGMHRAKDNLDVAKRENSVILVEKDYQESYQGFDPNSAESYIIFEFMQDNNMQRSVDLAKFVQKDVCSIANRPDKGVKQAGFLVLRETSMPSCLIELGFISTPAEEKLLNDEASIENIAKGIYNAFIKYKKKYDNNITVPYKAEEPTINVPEIIPQKQDNPKTENKSKEMDKKKEAKKKEDKKKEEKKVEKKPEQKTDDKEKVDNKVENTINTTPPQTTSKDSDAPIFKVQIVATDKPFKKGDPHFKGRTDYNMYMENGMAKYTIGASTDYTEIVKLKNELQPTFTDCFIVAFKKGQKMNITEAIQEYRKNKK